MKVIKFPKEDRGIEELLKEVEKHKDKMDAMMVIGLDKDACPNIWRSKASYYEMSFMLFALQNFLNWQFNDESREDEIE